MHAVPPPSRAPTGLPAWLAAALGPALVALLVVALAGLAIASAYQRSHAQAVAATQALARQAAARLADRFDRIDLYLQLVAQQRLGRAAVAPPDLDGVAIADAAGRVHTRLGPEPEPATPAAGNVGGQDFFRRAVADPQAGLVVSGPAPGVASDPARLVFARAVRDARGGVLGVVFAGTALAHFDSLFDDFGLWADGQAVLRTQDLQAVYRAPRQGAALAEDVVPAALRRALAAQPLQGAFDAPEGGEARLGAYQRLRGQPFYLVVTRPERSVLAAWRADAWTITGLAVLVLVAAGGVWWTQDRAARRRARRWRARCEALAQAAPDALFVCDRHGAILCWSAGAQRLFGHAEAEVLQRSPALLVPPERREEFARLSAHALRGESVHGVETVWPRRNGAPVEVALSLVPVLDEHGRPDGVAWSARDIARRKALEAEVRAMAFNDPLTLLPNRRLLLDRLRQAQLASSRQRSYYGVLFIDLDRFRLVNDRFGREAGDQLLMEVGRRLQAAVRQHDTVARLGSDEFVVLLEELGASEKSAADHVNTVADKVLDAIERVHHLRGELHRCSASIGIRLLVGSQDSPEQVLMDADAAMYRVKRQRLALKAFAFE